MGGRFKTPSKEKLSWQILLLTLKGFRIDCSGEVKIVYQLPQDLPGHAQRIPF
jgi:hypothetical protein